jgi:PAS domain S-box-containing protein
MAETSEDKFTLEQAFKQFLLESERLELTYKSLESQFKSVESTLHDTQVQLYGKVAQLDFSTNYLDAILAHMSQGILFIDRTGTVTTYNPAAQEIFGISADQILLHSFWDFFTDEALGFSLKEALQSKKCPKTAFISWATPSGNQIEIEIEASLVGVNATICPLATQKPMAIEVQGILLLARNITEFRRLQVLANRHDRLKDLGEITARMAHEIRNPLGGIRGFASLLQQDLKEHPDLQQMATQIVEGTDHLCRYVSNILDYARPVQPHFELIDLVPFMKEVLQLVQVDNAVGEQISCQFHSSYPTLVVPVDGHILRSALINLLVNGLQAMPEGGNLNLSLNKDEEQAVIGIQDTGVGIALENLDKIFSPFFTTKTFGNGLGLSEVYKAIQAHNGSIEVQSVVGEGSVFTVKIPLKVS